MSIEAVTWALSVPVGGNQKVVLLGLANHAHPDGTEAFPSLDTLKTYAHCDRSTARRNVRKLVELGWIREDGLGPKGQTKYVLAMSAKPFGRSGGEMPGGGETHPVAPAPARGGTGASEGVAPMPPEPSLGTVQEPPPLEPRARDEFPEDLSDELYDAAIAAGKILKRTALTRRQKKEVTRAAVGHAVLTYDDRDHVEVARSVENWLLHGRGAHQQCRDVVQRYRQFLKTSEPMAGPALPMGVTPLHRGQRMSNAERVDAKIRALSD